MSEFSGARRTVQFYLAVVAAMLVASCLFAQEAAKSHPTIVFMTDFGVVDDSVALCKGVMYSVAPDARIVDLTHEVNPFSILDGARFLYGTTPYFPSGTVFVVVIDPGVGSTRKAVVVKSKRGQYFVLPDNGLMTLVEQRDGLESAREITNPAWMIGGKLSSTFHGRDIFSPVGAHIVRGDDWTQVGPEVDVKGLVQLKLEAPRLDERGLHGSVIATDGPYGNLVTNLDADDFLKLGYQHGENVKLTVAGKEMTMPFVRTFSEVAQRKTLLYIDSRGHMALAVNQGNFAATFGIKPPVEILVERKH